MLELFPDDAEWMKDGLCASSTVEPDTWFGEPGEPDYHQKAKVAKRICSACPIKDLCLQYAIDNNERFGIWGGMTMRERTNYIKTQ